MYIKRILKKVFGVLFDFLCEIFAHPSQAKRYGMHGEDDFCHRLKRRIPSAKIKQNIRIETKEGRGEIDCLILFENKIFAVEVKSWKGQSIEEDGHFVQKKTDIWTGEVHEKHHRSPFTQLSRAIYLLKKQIPGNVWINGIVYFEGAERVTASEEYPWFLDMDEVCRYIKKDGRTSRKKEAEGFFHRCADSHGTRWFA